MTTVLNKCISADSHVTEPAGTYIDRIDPKFRDRAPRMHYDESFGDVMLIDNGKTLVPFWMVAAAGRPAEEVRLDTGKRFEDLWPGGWDPVARLSDQDIDGVSAEVIYPSVGMLLCNYPDIDYQHACFDAYNQWIAEFCATSPNRLIGMGQTAMRTPKEGIADLEAMKALGLRGVMLPGLPAQGDYDDPMYDEFWDAVVDLGLPPSFHILTSKTDNPFGEVRGPRLNTFMTILRANQDIIGLMIFGAVFERHPDLKIVCVEADAGWAPHWMYRADHAYDRHRNWLTAGELSSAPSEQFREHVYLTFQDDWVAFRTADLMNADRLMWANDFPHSDATWPHSQEMLAEHASHLSEHTRSRILHDNVAELYGIRDQPGSRMVDDADDASVGAAWTRVVPVALVVFAVAFGAVVRWRAELRDVFFPNDAGAHQALARFAEQRIRGGHNPFDAWFPYLGLGSPLFSQYQSLSHIITGALSIVFGHSLYRWLGYLLLCTLPVPVYVGARLLELDVWEAGAAALLSPLLVNINGYGFEWGSFVWLGSGMWSMLWALWLMPIALGLAWRAVAKGERYALTTFVVGLTCALHFITGYLVLLAIGVFVLVRPGSFVRRIGRGALVGGGGLAVFAFVFVPAILGLRYQNVEAFQVGTFWIDSYGPSKVLPWLFRGEIFDHSRFPTVSLLVAAGVIACIWTFRRRETARVALGLMVLSLMLYSGRRVVGPVIDRLPGGDHLFLHRYVIGVHYAGLLLAGMGSVAAIRLLVRGARRFGSGTARDAAVFVGVGILCIALVLPLLIERRRYAQRNASFIAAQVTADATDGKDLTTLIDIVRRRGDGRIYAGASSNWGAGTKLDQVPLYQLPVQLDTDSLGFYLRTDSLSADIEPYFDDKNAAQYDLFNVKYVLLPNGQEPTVAAKEIARRGNYTLYEVPTSGYLEPVDTTEPMAADNRNMASVMRPYIESPGLATRQVPLVAFDGRATPAPSSSTNAPYTGPPGVVDTSTASLADARFGGRVTATRASWVMLKQSYSPRWTATVDGKPVKTAMLAPSYVGVPVPAGTHVVTFQYRPRSSYPALFALGAFVLLAIALAPRGWRRWKRKSGSVATAAG